MQLVLPWYLELQQVGQTHLFPFQHSPGPSEALIPGPLPRKLQNENTRQIRKVTASAQHNYCSPEISASLANCQLRLLILDFSQITYFIQQGRGNLWPACRDVCLQMMTTVLWSSCCVQRCHPFSSSPDPCGTFVSLWHLCSALFYFGFCCFLPQEESFTTGLSTVTVLK